MSMSRPYEFKPILTIEKFQASLEYLAIGSQKLARMVLGCELSIDTICLFTHSDTEHAFVEQLVRSSGPVSKFTHGATLYATVDMQIGDQHTHILGVRKPDDTRSEVGYGDYPITDYDSFLRESTGNKYLKQIVSGCGQPLVELRHPDIGVLGYAFDAHEHE